MSTWKGKEKIEVKRVKMDKGRKEGKRGCMKNTGWQYQFWGRG
jgi:hypothetical protein